MPRPRKEIAPQAPQSEEEPERDSGSEEAGPNVAALGLLDQLSALAPQVQTLVEQDRGAWVQKQILSLIAQLKAAL